jgi:predicted aspartyl protease
VEIEVGDPGAHRFERIDALVGTGATYTSLPRPLLDALGVTLTRVTAFCSPTAGASSAISGAPGSGSAETPR